MKTSIRGSIAAAALCALLAACGGSGSDTPPTPLPASVAISNDARADAGATATFRTDLASTDGLSFRWDFGDGNTATGATASHVYAKSGTYQVTLAVANDAEDLRTSTSTIEIGAYANVAGLNCTQSGSAGWCWQHALATGHQINDVFFVDATHAWAVGDDLTILKSSDSGATWTPVPVDASLAPASLRSVRFYDATHGMALTDQGSALQTSDGGATWSINPLSGPSYYTINAFVEYGASRILLQSTPYGVAIVSTDGGTTWTQVTTAGQLQTAGTDCWTFSYSQVTRNAGCGASSVASLAIDPNFYGYEGFAAAAFPGATQGLVLGYAFSYSTYTGSPTAWSTADGTNWTSFQPAGLSYYSYYSNLALSMSDALNGILYSTVDLGAFVTADGGHNWSTVTSSTALSQVSGTYRATGVAGGSTLWQSVGNHVSISLDRGQTWNDTVVHDEDAAAPTAQTTAALMAQYIDANDFVVSVGHRFYVTHDAGKTYTRMLGPDSRDAGASPAAGFFFDAKSGTFLTSNGALLSTADGGRTWSRSDFPTASSTPVALHFISATEGYLLLNGTLAHSTDAGATWAKPLVDSAMAGLQGMSWGDAMHGWTWNSNTLYTTADAGAHWTAAVLPAAGYYLSSAAMTGALAGVVSTGYGTVLTTQDGGATWQTGAANAVYGTLVHTSGQTIWALSNTTMRSKDGGHSWQSAGPSNYSTAATAISFADDLDGWMLTAAGNVLRTVDGGDTWSAQVVGTDLTLTALVAVDSQTAWIITRDGQILSTATAGN